MHRLKIRFLKGQRWNIVVPVSLADEPPDAARVGPHARLEPPVDAERRDDVISHLYPYGRPESELSWHCGFISPFYGAKYIFRIRITVQCGRGSTFSDSFCIVFSNHCYGELVLISILLVHHTSTSSKEHPKGYDIIQINPQYQFKSDSGVP